MHDHASVECPGLRGREEALELRPPGAARKPACDEQRDPLVRDPERIELVERRRERGRSRIVLCARDWERGRLDHDGHPRVALDQIRERGACERERERVSDRRRDVDHV